MLIPSILFVDIDDNNLTTKIAYFTAAKKLGLTCIVVADKSRNDNKQLDDLSDHIFIVNEITEGNLVKLITSLKTKFNIQIITCQAGQASSKAQIGCIVANVCKKIGLIYPSATSINICNNKFLMRYTLSLHSVPSVKYELVNNLNDALEIAEKIGYPIIAKPPFGAASSYVKKCNNPEDLSDYYSIYRATFKIFSKKQNSYGSVENIKLPQKEYNFIPGSSVLLEEYLSGKEGTVECVITNGEIYPLLINEKLIMTETNTTVLEDLLITPPVSFSITEVESIKKYAVQCIKAVGLNNAIVHLEFKLVNGNPIVLEINPRLGGLYVYSAFKDICGVDPDILYLLILHGMKSKVDEIISNAKCKMQIPNNFYSMLVLYPSVSGVFKEVHGLEYIESDKRIIDYQIANIGSYANAETEETYLLKAWVRIKSKQEILELYNNIKKNVKMIIE